ncbi:hypothetical protein J6V86_01425 [bacterium]|nr:hypothetical protein [bacterium]
MFVSVLSVFSLSGLVTSSHVSSNVSLSHSSSASASFSSSCVSSCVISSSSEDHSLSSFESQSSESHDSSEFQSSELKPESFSLKESPPPVESPVLPALS